VLLGCGRARTFSIYLLLTSRTCSKESTLYTSSVASLFNVVLEYPGIYSFSGVKAIKYIVPTISNIEKILPKINTFNRVNLKVSFSSKVSSFKTTKRYLLLKSRIHYRAGFKPIAKHIVECSGIGVTGSDYSQFKFEKVRRPIFPLDLDMEL